MVPIVGCLTLVSEATIGFIDVALAPYLHFVQVIMAYIITVGTVSTVTRVTDHRNPRYGNQGSDRDNVCSQWVFFHCQCQSVVNGRSNGLKSHF